MTGETRELLDLDNSVFMNFKRYTKQDVANCFEADMRASNFENVISDEQELSFCASVFEENYATYCQAFHEISAQFDHFPLIKLTDLAEVLYSLGIFAREKAKPISERVIKVYRDNVAAENAEQSGLKKILDEEEEELFNRVQFAEVLLLVIKADHEDSSHFSFNRELRIMFKEHITPFMNVKEPD